MTTWKDYVKENRKDGETYKAAMSRCSAGYQACKPKKDVVKPKVDKAAKIANIPMKPPSKVKKPRKKKVVEPVKEVEASSTY